MPAILHIEPSTGSTVRFISDLHLAHKRSCAPAPRKLIESMVGIDMLVLAGDTAETRETCIEREYGMQLRAELREQCHKKGIKLVELAGNHDPDVEGQLALFWGGKVASMHGHSLLRRVSPWSREYILCSNDVKHLIAMHPEAEYNLEARLMLTKEITQLLSKNVVPAEEKAKRRGLLDEAYHCLWPPQRPISIVTSWLTCGCRASFFCKRYLPEVELLIIGHFHRGGQWSNSGRLTLNTGAWFEHAIPYAADVRDGRLICYKRYVDL